MVMVVCSLAALVIGSVRPCWVGHDLTWRLRTAAARTKRLHVADDGLCFGRLDALSGDRTYIGRIGLFDEDNGYAPVLLDWRPTGPPTGR